MTTDPGDLCLDPTCGSGTTAYVAEQWGRRWITCDTSRVALALARTRLMAAKYPYYLLADSPEGQQKEMELTGQPSSFVFGPSSVVGPPSPTVSRPTSDIKKGFVYKRVPHVTLKSIANNEEIDAIHAQWQAQLDELRGQLNALLGQSWEEWQVPRDLEAVAEELGKATKNPALTAQIRNPQSEIRNLHAQWWTLRRDRQRAIDASIAKRADTETLYDQPVEDKKVVRVSGPFTVESLSPHRMLDTDDEIDAAASRQGAQREQDFASGGFTGMILDNLRKAGVQNTKQGERLTFDRLDPYPGSWIHATGEYTEAPSPAAAGEGPGVGAVRRVAVSIGPEHGTVGPQHVKEAAKEAVQGVGYDLLLVCGFAFDPHVPEEAKRYGKLIVLPTKMNPDLAMGDELLKKTGAGNLFMIFGEPDVEMTRLPRLLGEGGRLCLLRVTATSSSSRSRAWMSTIPPPARSAPPPPTTSPAGSSTPTMTARASWCATPTSPARPSRTTSSSAPCGRKSTSRPGPASTAPGAGPSPGPPRASSPSKSSTTTAMKCSRCMMWRSSRRARRLYFLTESKMRFRFVALLALIGALLAACNSTPAAPAPTSAPAARLAVAPQGTPLYDADLCAWFEKALKLRITRITALNEFSAWVDNHGEGTKLQESDLRELLRILKGAQPYQKEFLAQWQLLGPRPRARAFWDGELKAVQLRADSFDDLINGLEKPEVETYKRGWRRFAEAAILGREAEATGQPLGAQCAATTR